MPEIVRLTPDNTGLLDRVATDVFDDPVDPVRLTSYVAAPGHFMLLAVADAIVVGQCAAVIHRHPDKVTELYIDEVGVAPEFRRQGIAGRMLEAMLAIGRAEGAGEAWVGTEPDNVAARGLYDSFAPKEAEPFVMYLYDI
ncbi:GNAT family N-acetyltransferase [soil metagenome]